MACPCSCVHGVQRAVPHPATQGLVGVLDAAEAACGRRDQLPQLLEGCIAASLEAAFDAALEQLSDNVTVGEA